MHRARWMLWEAPPLESTAKRLASLGVGVVVYGSCANAPDRGDFLSVMRENAQALEAAFAGTLHEANLGIASGVGSK